VCAKKMKFISHTAVPVLRIYGDMSETGCRQKFMSSGNVEGLIVLVAMFYVFHIQFGPRHA